MYQVDRLKSTAPQTAAAELIQLSSLLVFDLTEEGRQWSIAVQGLGWYLQGGQKKWKLDPDSKSLLAQESQKRDCWESTDPQT